MLIEVVALQAPHHYEGVVTIHLKKLLAGEPGEVNSVCSGGFTQEKTYYCAKCCTSFHGRCSMLCFMHARAGAQGGRVKPPVAVDNQNPNHQPAALRSTAIHGGLLMLGHMRERIRARQTHHRQWGRAAASIRTAEASTLH